MAHHPQEDVIVLHNKYDPRSKFRTAVGTIAAFLLLGIPIGITFCLQGNWVMGLPALVCAALGLVGSVITLR